MNSFLRRELMVAKKDVHMSEHPKLVDKNVPNLHVAS